MANSELVGNIKKYKEQRIEVNKNIFEMKNTGNCEANFTFGLGTCMVNGETDCQSAWGYVVS